MEGIRAGTDNVMDRSSVQAPVCVTLEPARMSNHAL